MALRYNNNLLCLCYCTGISAPTFSTDGTNIIMEIGIADTHLGSVLGKGGYIIKDIMGSTGVKIQISQKGEYFPGTNQRIMKVVGLQQQVSICSYYIYMMVSFSQILNLCAVF